MRFRTRASALSFGCALMCVAVALPLATAQDDQRGGPVVLVEAVEPARATAAPRAAMLERIRKSPEWLANEGIRRYNESIKDYTCTFWKQERINGRLGKVEKIDVTYAQGPVHSVFMRWQANADQAKRVLWRDHPDFRNRKGDKLAKVEPNGAIVRLLISEVEMPIHGARAKKASRSPIDQFGFLRAMELMQEDCLRAEAEGVLDLRYEGEGEIDGRPTFKLVRYLPYEGEGGRWPNAKLIMHVDQEWLIPTAVYGYSDRDGRQLLCSYVYTDVTLNPQLSEASFKF